MLSVFDYSDYRQFIKEYYETHKAQNPSFSYRYLAQKAGINSAPFYKFIIEGKRNLTKNTVLKTCVALKLSDREAEYFENLVFFNQAKTVKEKNSFFEKLVQKQKHRHVGTIAENQYEYFSEWYHCVIRELVCMYDCRENWAKLGRIISPPITPKQVEESVKLLLRLGFIKKAGSRYLQTEPVLSAGYGLTSHQIINFQIMMLNKAIEAFDRSLPHERLTSATTVSISRKNYEVFVEKIRTLRSELLELARNDASGEMVYELTLNLFPLSLPRESL
jgi:uncharacterized protein (TIGR02147 family)